MRFDCEQKSFLNLYQIAVKKKVPNPIYSIPPKKLLLDVDSSNQHVSDAIEDVNWLLTCYC